MYFYVGEKRGFKTRCYIYLGKMNFLGTIIFHKILDNMIRAVFKASIHPFLIIYIECVISRDPSLEVWRVEFTIVPVKPLTDNGYTTSLFFYRIY